MSPVISGRALILGHDVNTDELHPSMFYSLDDDRVRSGFLGAVQGKQAPARSDEGLIVVAGRNFGCGSSRETGARVFGLVGVRAVVALSFARIFQRNLINLGLPALPCPGLDDTALASLSDGQPLRIDLTSQLLVAGEAHFALERLDPLHQGILLAGGLAEYLELLP